MYYQEKANALWRVFSFCNYSFSTNKRRIKSIMLNNKIKKVRNAHTKKRVCKDIEKIIKI